MLSSIIGSVTIVADPIIGCQTNERRINMLFSDVDAIAKAASNKAELCTGFCPCPGAGEYMEKTCLLKAGIWKHEAVRQQREGGENER